MLHGMDSPALFLALANLILVVHGLFVLFVVLGLLLVVVGGSLKWRWIRNRRFRLAHLAAIAFVVAESWVGLVCPLTSLENRLRGLAGHAGYEGGFIEFWLHRLLFFELPGWVFIAGYTAFGALVAFCWRAFPPAGRELPGRDD